MSKEIPLDVNIVSILIFIAAIVFPIKVYGSIFGWTFLTIADKTASQTVVSILIYLILLAFFALLIWVGISFRHGKKHSWSFTLGINGLIIIFSLFFLDLITVIICIAVFYLLLNKRTKTYFKIGTKTQKT